MTDARADSSAGAESIEIRLGELLAGAMELPAEEQRAYLESGCDAPALIEEALSLLEFDAEGGKNFLHEPAARLLDGGAFSDQESDLENTELEGAGISGQKKAGLGGVAVGEAGPGGAALHGAGPGDAGRLGTAAEEEAPWPSTEPRRIGSFTLLDRLGEGGMGKVYRAMQAGPVERQVAIKVMSQAAPSPEARRRFDLERQALGRLNHPNIARLYEAGTTADGRPFVAMEIVEGLRVTQYCDLHGFTIEERLRLFVDICRGLQHAHQKQILHRDLKPSNLLVTDADGAPVAKIIDFGIARALDQPADHTFATGDRLVGTPHYMSPEALRPTNHGGVDTRTDIYSLGVVLFELVVGVRPFETPASDLPRLMQEILEESPKKPSVRLEELDDSTRYLLASNRGIVPEVHLAALRGDLDAIVAKVLERNRDRRYASAKELGDEAQRILDHLPVEARSPSTIYRARKWARRNRVAASLGAVAVGGLIVALTLAGLSLQRAHRAEAQSRLDAELSRQSLGFVLDLFDAVSTDGSLRQDASVRDLLNQGVLSLRDSELNPIAKAEILETLGEVHLRLGLYPPARELLTESLSIRERELSPEAPETLDTARLLGNLERRAGHHEAAERHLLRVLAGAEQDREEAPLKLADALGSLGNLRWSQGRLDEALELHGKALHVRQRELGGDADAVAVSHNNLGTLHYSASDLKSAEAHLRRAAAIFEARLGPRHPQVATALGNLVLVLQVQGDLNGAERLQRRILGIHWEAFGGDHPASATATHNLAGVVSSLGRLEEARGLYQAALDRRRRALGEDHPETLSSRAALGRLFWRMGRYQEAEERLLGTLSLHEASSEPETEAAYRLRYYLAVVRRDAGLVTEARAELVRILEWQNRTLGPYDRDVSRTLFDLGVCEQRLGLLEEAEESMRRALELQRRGGGQDLYVAQTLFALGELLEEQRPDEAVSFFAEARTLRRARLPENHPDRIQSENRAAMKSDG